MHNFLNLNLLSFWRVKICDNIFCSILIGRCNKDQKCISVHECPYTNRTLENLMTTNDAKEKEKMIASVKSLICGSTVDKTVCCDIDNNGEY